MNSRLLEAHNLCLQIKTQTLALRLRTLAEFFLGTNFGAWEDGSNLESLDDFKYKLDTLDCVTFVEVVLALAKTKPIDNFTEFSKQFENVLRMIHYNKGVTNFISRNHFMCCDWIPNNKFIVEDITLSLSVDAKIAQALIDKASWTKRHKILQTSSHELPKNIVKQLAPVVSKVPYIESVDFFANTAKFEENFPDFCIVNIVRPNWNLTEKIGTHLNISHLGFSFKDPTTKQLSFYHSTVDKQLVVKETLYDYLQRFKDNPTIKGINILVISPGYYSAS